MSGRVECESDALRGPAGNARGGRLRRQALIRRSGAARVVVRRLLPEKRRAAGRRDAARRRRRGRRRRRTRRRHREPVVVVVVVRLVHSDRCVVVRVGRRRRRGGQLVGARAEQLPELLAGAVGQLIRVHVRVLHRATRTQSASASTSASGSGDRQRRPNARQLKQVSRSRRGLLRGDERESRGGHRNRRSDRRARATPAAGAQHERARRGPADGRRGGCGSGGSAEDAGRERERERAAVLRGEHLEAGHERHERGHLDGHGEQERGLVLLRGEQVGQRVQVLELHRVGVRGDLLRGLRQHLDRVALRHRRDVLQSETTATTVQYVLELLQLHKYVRGSFEK